MKLKIMRDDFRFEDVWNLMEHTLRSFWSNEDINQKRGNFLSKLNDGFNLFFILEHENNVIGVGVLDNTNSDIASLEALCVQHVFRGKLLGSQLLKYICDYVKQRNGKQLQIVCNKQYDSFFMKNGFVKENHHLAMQF